MLFVCLLFVFFWGAVKTPVTVTTLRLLFAKKGKVRVDRTDVSLFCAKRINLESSHESFFVFFCFFLASRPSTLSRPASLSTSFPPPMLTFYMKTCIHNCTAFRQQSRASKRTTTDKNISSMMVADMVATAMYLRQLAQVVEMGSLLELNSGDALCPEPSTIVCHVVGGGLDLSPGIDALLQVGEYVVVFLWSWGGELVEHYATHPQVVVRSLDNHLKDIMVFDQGSSSKSDGTGFGMDDQQGSGSHQNSPNVGPSIPPSIGDIGTAVTSKSPPALLDTPPSMFSTMPPRRSSQDNPWGAPSSFR